MNNNFPLCNFADQLMTHMMYTPSVTEQLMSEQSLLQLANNITREKLSLKELTLSKENLFNLAPKLEFVNCRDLFLGWDKEKTLEFLNLCAPNVKNLIINEGLIDTLPDLPKCETLDCSGCIALNALPSIPKCEKLAFAGCKRLEEMFQGFSSEIVLTCKNGNHTLEEINEIDDIDLLRLLLNLKKITLNDLKLEFSRLLLLASKLNLLQWENAFENWTVGEVKDFLTLCPKNITFLPTTSIDDIISNQEEKLKTSIPAFITTYIEKTVGISPNQRHLKFQDFIVRHDANIPEKLADLISITFLTLKLDLPHISLAKLQKTLNRFELSLTNEDKVSIEPNIKALEAKIKIAVTKAKNELENYFEVLKIAIIEKQVPKDVLNKLIHAATIRINPLKNFLTLEDFVQMILEVRALENHIKQVTPNLYLDSSRLKKASTNLKTGMTKDELNSRILEKEQIKRVKEKLEKELSSIQADLDKTKFTDDELEDFLSERIEKGRLETLDTDLIEILEENFNSLCIAHVQGDRPSQEDTHLATVISINFGKETIQVPLYGIFDGHGGQDGSKFLSENLARKLKFELDNAFKAIDRSNQEEVDSAIFNTLKTIFEKMTQEYLSRDLKKGGSTACLSLILDGKLWVANLGDTRAILSVNGLPIVLSRDGGLETEEQKRTIAKRGGTIVECGNPPTYSELRVNPFSQYIFVPNKKVGLNMSRSACEHMYPLNTRSKITCFPLNLLPPGVKTLCIACDGAFDVLSSTDVAKVLFEKFQDSESLSEVASSIIEEAYNKGSTDNISTLLLDLNFPLESRRLIKRAEEKEEKF